MIKTINNLLFLAKKWFNLQLHNFLTKNKFDKPKILINKARNIK